MGSVSKNHHPSVASFLERNLNKSSTNVKQADSDGKGSFKIVKVDYDVNVSVTVVTPIIRTDYIIN